MKNKYRIIVAGMCLIGLSQLATAAGFSKESLQSLAQALQKTCWEISRTDSGDIILKPRRRQNAGSGQISSASNQMSSDLSALRKALESAGWKTERTDSGDLLLFPEGDAPPLINAKDATPVQASPATDIQDSIIDFATLPQRLRAAGWVVRKDEDGSLTIRWPASGEQSVPVAKNNASMDELQQTLERSGWYVEKTDGGDLLLFPRKSGPEAGSGGAAPEQINNTAFAEGKTGPVPGVSGAVTDLDELQQSLEAAGWITSRDKKGDLVVYWSETETADQGTEDENGHSADDLQRLIPLLENTGWQAKQTASGDLLLYPQQPVQDSPTARVATPADQQPALADSDADGVPDEHDLCPGSDKAVQVDKTGCAVDSLVLKGVTFKYSSSRLTPEAKTFLKQQAARMRQYPGLRFRITGHTDSRGSAARNQKLSENRARAVFLYLIKQGVSEDAMVYSGAGETRPLASNATAEGRQKNRRVELHIISSGNE